MNCPTCGLNIDEHPAGRCLDAWVAEAVFRRQVKYVSPEELPPAGKIDGVPILRKHGVWLLDDYDPEQDGITASLWDVPASHVPHYSIDIAAAWTIGKAGWIWLFSDGWSPDVPGFGIEAILIDAHRHRREFKATVAYSELGIRTVDQTGPAYALARCRAALRAAETEHG